MSIRKSGLRKRVIIFFKSFPLPPGVPQVHGGQCGAGRRHLHREEGDPQGGQAHGRHWQDPGGGVAPLEEGD